MLTPEEIPVLRDLHIRAIWNRETLPQEDQILKDLLEAKATPRDLEITYGALRMKITRISCKTPYVISIIADPPSS